MQLDPVGVGGHKARETSWAIVGAVTGAPAATARQVRHRSPPSVPDSIRVRCVIFGGLWVVRWGRLRRTRFLSLGCEAAVFACHLVVTARP